MLGSFISRTLGQTDAQPRTVIYKETCDTQEGGQCPVSRMHGPSSLRGFITHHHVMCNLTSTQIGSLNFFLELKIHTRGQYVSYKLQKTVVCSRGIASTVKPVAGTDTRRKTGMRQLGRHGSRGAAGANRRTAWRSVPAGTGGPLPPPPSLCVWEEEAEGSEGSGRTPEK